MSRKNVSVTVALFAASIALANWLTATFGLVPIGLGLAVTAGTFAAGAALLLRDGVQQAGGSRAVMAALGIGFALSYLLSDPMIAAASAVAFLGSELLDWAVFSRWRGRSVPEAVLLSSVASAPVDTVLFLYLAGFPLTWQAVAGQFVVKTAMAATASAALAARGQDAVPQRS